MDWQQRLKEKKILISDGAWGTELAKLGLQPGDAPELLNLNNPQIVTTVARSYVDAGADIILSNTFGASPFKLSKVNLADKTAELNRLGVALSRQAAGNNALVFASIGPTGEFMEPLGDKTEDEFISCFAMQATACAEGGADAILIETMTDLAEAKAALKAVRQATTLPVVVSFTFDKGPKGFATMMGVTPATMATELSKAGADIIGSNCGAGIDNMIIITKELRAHTQLPLWIKANAGLPQLIKGKTVFMETPAQTAARIPELIDAGANIAGGCCGTTPAHISAILTAARKHLA